jgi:hypothetical protein
MYDDILQFVMSQNTYYIPPNGIPTPEKENALNLFIRELKLEEYAKCLSNRNIEEVKQVLIDIQLPETNKVFNSQAIAWVNILEGKLKLFMERVLKSNKKDFSIEKKAAFIIVSP